jgi:hypothetical protein
MPDLSDEERLRRQRAVDFARATESYFGESCHPVHADKAAPSEMMSLPWSPYRH